MQQDGLPEQMHKSKDVNEKTTWRPIQSSYFLSYISGVTSKTAAENHVHAATFDTVCIIQETRKSTGVNTSIFIVEQLDLSSRYVMSPAVAGI